MDNKISSYILNVSVLILKYLFLQTDSGVSGASAPPKKKSLIDQFFSIEFETTYPKNF